MDKNDVINIVSQDEYLSISDLRYNRNLGFLLSREEFNLFLKLKDELITENNSLFVVLPLKSFNSKHIYFVNSAYLKYYSSEYFRILSFDYKNNHSSLLNRNIDDIIKSHLFSEIEGTLNIENVPTTHKRIAELYKEHKVLDQNDIIVKNMFNALKFIVSEKPEFNKENLLKIYKMLSENSLAKELEIKPENYYRDDNVYIGNHEGAPVNKIEECMESLFSFVNSGSDLIKQFKDFIPHICHYYILYVHPYFDFNGRTARVVAFWLSYIMNIKSAPLFISEAINETKHEYYNSIEESRNTNNDITSFLGYIFNTSIKYSFVYQNLEHIKEYVLKNGDALTNTEWVYVKKILIHNNSGFFNCKQFQQFISNSISKQGASKFLNKFVMYDILT